MLNLNQALPWLLLMRSRRRRKLSPSSQQAELLRFFSARFDLWRAHTLLHLAEATFFFFLSLMSSYQMNFLLSSHFEMQPCWVLAPVGLFVSVLNSCSSRCLILCFHKLAKLYHPLVPRIAMGSSLSSNICNLTFLFKLLSCTCLSC